jgi:hypothetical protein
VEGQWGGKLRTIQDTTRWLGFYLDPLRNWRALVKIPVQQGLGRQQKSRQSYATLGDKQEALTYSSMVNIHGHGCLWNRSNMGRTAMDRTVIHKLTAWIGRDVSGTFASTMGVDAIREAAAPPTRAAVDRQTERQFNRMITNYNEHPCKNYVNEWDCQTPLT